MFIILENLRKRSPGSQECVPEENVQNLPILFFFCASKTIFSHIFEKGNWKTIFHQEDSEDNIKMH